MKYGIIADIHGQIDSMKKAFYLLSHVDQTVFLGDLPPYRGIDGLDEGLALLKKNSVRPLLGNCDAHLIRCRRPDGIGEENWQWYTNWPKEIRDGDLLFVHGGPRNTMEERIDSEDVAWKNFLSSEFRICFHGHQHRAVLYKHENDCTEAIAFQESKEIALLPDARYLVCVGSVGNPRDDLNGSFVIYDSDKETLQLKRFELL